jgi:hypothetical protein
VQEANSKNSDRLLLPMATFSPLFVARLCKTNVIKRILLIVTFADGHLFLVLEACVDLCLHLSATGISPENLFAISADNCMYISSNIFFYDL